MSADWVLIDADLSSYSSIKFKSGGRLYFLKAGRKNVSIYDLALRKNVSLKLSAIPKFFLEKGKDLQQKILDRYPNTLKRILKNFRGYTQKTNTEKSILDTLKKIS
tara:strand:- start:133 stop:450 length:318 start_codon:yes stop_codon:yes gene_type:complete